MEFYTEYKTFNTREKREYVNITRDVAEVLEKSGISEGMVLVAAMHITAGVYINDAECLGIDDYIYIGNDEN